MRRAEQLITLDFIKENLRRASKESIAIIKPRENKRENKSSGSFSKRYCQIEPIRLISK